MKDVDKIIKILKKLNIRNSHYIRKNVILNKFRKKLCKKCKSRKKQFCILLR